MKKYSSHATEANRYKQFQEHHEGEKDGGLI
jgi:hypothetical protein